MSKFNVVKKFSLDFVDESWKEAYINFSSLTIGDVRKYFPALAKLETSDEVKEKNKEKVTVQEAEKQEADLTAGLDAMLNVVQAKFVSGKVPDVEGKLIDLTKEDLVDLPVNILEEVFNFLSQGVTKASPQPSEKSSQQADQ